MIFGADLPGADVCSPNAFATSAAQQPQSLAPQHHVYNCQWPAGDQSAALLFAEIPVVFIGRKQLDVEASWQCIQYRVGTNVRLRITVRGAAIEQCTISTSPGRGLSRSSPTSHDSLLRAVPLVLSWQRYNYSEKWCGHEFGPGLRSSTGCMCSLRASTLPNGLRVHHVSQQDLNFIYDEVFVQRSYLQHGVALHLGDTVLDIGAPSVCNQAHVCRP